MIPIEKLCITLEQARKLKELGVEQDSHYYWVKWKNNNDYSLIHKSAMDCYDEVYSAFTIGELSYMIYENFCVKDLFEDIEYCITIIGNTELFNQVIKG